MPSSEKLLIGPRIARFRKTLGLTQSRMAEDLGISTSYLNLMERNQRSLSANVLLRMAEIYDFDIASFTGSGDAHLVAEVYETLRDPIFKGDSLSKNEAEDLVNVSPSAARSLIKLYGKHRDTTLRASENISDRDHVELLEQSSQAVDSVRRFLHKQKNYFPALDAAAEKLAKDLGYNKAQIGMTLTKRLQEKHDISVRVVPVDIMPQMLRYFDRHSKRINLSELLPQSGRRFQLAYQISILEYRNLIDEVVDSANLNSSEAEGLCRTTLANYFAAAILMPYDRFLKEGKIVSTMLIFCVIDLVLVLSKLRIALQHFKNLTQEVYLSSLYV